MIRRKFCFLPLFLLLGIALPMTGALAQDKDKPHPFRNLPPQERRQAVEKFRQERAQNPGRIQNPNGVPQRPEDNRNRAAEKLRQADTNRDGALSREEAGKAMPRFSRHFDEADANRDGVVTREELRAFRERRRQQRIDRGGGDPRD
jgi:hypothetical protein